MLASVFEEFAEHDGQNQPLVDSLVCQLGGGCVNVVARERCLHAADVIGSAEAPFIVCDAQVWILHFEEEG